MQLFITEKSHFAAGLLSGIFYKLNEDITFFLALQYPTASFLF